MGRADTLLCSGGMRSGAETQERGGGQTTLRVLAGGQRGQSDGPGADWPAVKRAGRQVSGGCGVGERVGSEGLAAATALVAHQQARGGHTRAPGARASSDAGHEERKSDAVERNRQWTQAREGWQGRRRPWPAHGQEAAWWRGGGLPRRMDAWMGACMHAGGRA